MKKMFSILSLIDDYDLEIPVLIFIYIVLAILFIVFLSKWADGLLETFPYFN